MYVSSFIGYAVILLISLTGEQILLWQLWYCSLFKLIQSHCNMRTWLIESIKLHVSITAIIFSLYCSFQFHHQASPEYNSLKWWKRWFFLSGAVNSQGTEQVKDKVWTPECVSKDVPLCFKLCPKGEELCSPCECRPKASDHQTLSAADTAGEWMWLYKIYLLLGGFQNWGYCQFFVFQRNWPRSRMITGHQNVF